MNDDDKKVILSRRARFMAAALAGLASAAAPGCSEAQACLEMPHDSGVDAATGGAGGSAGQGGSAGEPQMCLQPPYDAGTGDAGQGGSAGEPQMCLQPPYDAGAGGGGAGGPSVCLSFR
jgi:hypothetical protein